MNEYTLNIGRSKKYDGTKECYTNPAWTISLEDIELRSLDRDSKSNFYNTLVSPFYFDKEHLEHLYDAISKILLSTKSEDHNDEVKDFVLLLIGKDETYFSFIKSLDQMIAEDCLPYSKNLMMQTLNSLFDDGSITMKGEVFSLTQKGVKRITNYL